MKIIQYNSPIGKLFLWFDDNLILLKIEKAQNTKNIAEINTSYPIIKSLDDYFLGKTKNIEYPLTLDIISEFDKKVLNLVRQIPYGSTVTYKFLAEKLNTSARAVGQALKRNPYPLIIPCHRVIKSDGSIGGFSLGVNAKKWLLEHEKAILCRLLSHKI
ncbi:methylated-DNA--[protein]-cysteine S-methyltransferase [Thermodesulfovibrio hydrogeniphilus]